MTHLQSLAWEFVYAVGAAIKKKSRPAYEIEYLLSTYCVLVPILHTSYGLSHLISNNPIQQMAVILILEMMKLSTENLRHLVRVTQLGSD